MRLASLAESGTQANVGRALVETCRDHDVTPATRSQEGRKAPEWRRIVMYWDDSTFSFLSLLFGFF